MEEALELERIEQEKQMEDQIAEYEKWANDGNDVEHSCESQFIPCPLCQGLQGLIATADANQSFVCSNHRIGICNFRIASHGLSLQQLFHRFRNVYDYHGLECPGVPTFHVENCFSNSKLVATCSSCELNATVL